MPNEKVASGARRGAGNEPKRPRDPGTGKAVTKPTDDPTLSGADLTRSLADPISTPMRVAQQTERFFESTKKLDWGAYADALLDSTRKLRNGDLTHIEDMLMHQASALQSIFTRLTERGLSCTEIPSIDLFMRYGLRAQSQCRATLETLAAVKNPPVVYARQANVTTGPQQVNNGVSPPPSRAREKSIAPNELSGVSHELRPDPGTPPLARATDSPVAAVGALDRTTERSRES